VVADSPGNYCLTINTTSLNTLPRLFPTHRHNLFYFRILIMSLGFVFNEANRYDIGKLPEINDLIDVVDSGIFGGIKGKQFQSSNSCRAFTCPNGNASSCSILDFPQCTDISGVEGIDYNLAYSYFFISGKSIDFDRDWEADGYTNGLISMLWKGAPVYGSRLKNPADGVFGSDIDFAAYTALEKDDTFSELQVSFIYSYIQAYHSLTLSHQFFKEELNITSLLSQNDTEFCLIGSGPNCDQLDLLTNRTPSALDYPHRFVTNFPTLKFNPSSNSEFADPLEQIKQGRGKSRDDPVSFDEWEDYGEAFYSPGATNPELKDCSQGSCVSISDIPIQYFGFGQSSGGDWALNDCIAYHEVGHAVVAKFLPNLASFILASDGIKSDPGAMVWTLVFLMGLE
jgi:hypothetical protein